MCVRRQKANRGFLEFARRNNHVVVVGVWAGESQDILHSQVSEASPFGRLSTPAVGHLIDAQLLASAYGSGIVRSSSM